MSVLIPEGRARARGKAPAPAPQAPKDFQGRLRELRRLGGVVETEIEGQRAARITRVGEQFLRTGEFRQRGGVPSGIAGLPARAFTEERDIRRAVRPVGANREFFVLESGEIISQGQVGRLREERLDREATERTNVTIRSQRTRNERSLRGLRAQGVTSAGRGAGGGGGAFRPRALLAGGGLMDLLLARVK